MNEILQTMWHTWTTGGWVMGAMVMLSLVMYATAAHLLMTAYHRGLTKATDVVLRNWVAQPERARPSMRELIRYTQDEVQSVKDIEGRFREVEATQVSDLDRRVAFLNVLVISAPLFGLLGTVLGMLLTFKAIGMGGSSASEIIAKGISEALVATQTGMMIAIPGLIMANIAKRWRNEYVAFLARLESVTLRHFRPEFHGMTRFFTRKDVKVTEVKPARTEAVPA
jgi:biopolymer transport protein ExbB